MAAGPTSRPAESAAVAASVAVLIAWAVGLTDPAVFAALVVVVGAVPATVTWLVELRRRSAK